MYKWINEISEVVSLRVLFDLWNLIESLSLLICGTLIPIMSNKHFCRLLTILGPSSVVQVKAALSLS
jgi:hypothetical protein